MKSIGMQSLFQELLIFLQNLSESLYISKYIYLFVKKNTAIMNKKNQSDNYSLKSMLFDALAYHYFKLKVIQLMEFFSWTTLSYVMHPFSHKNPSFCTTIKNKERNSQRKCYTSSFVIEILQGICFKRDAFMFLLMGQSIITSFFL